MGILMAKSFAPKKVTKGVIKNTSIVLNPYDCPKKNRGNFPSIRKSCAIIPKTASSPFRNKAALLKRGKRLKKAIVKTTKTSSTGFRPIDL
jgi:hypothetical protein